MKPKTRIQRKEEDPKNKTMNNIGVIVGTNGSGKTTYCINLIYDIISKYNRVLIINCSGEKKWDMISNKISVNSSPLFDGIKQIDLSEKYMSLNKKNRYIYLQRVFKFIRYCVNSLIIFDDIRIISNHNITDELKFLCVSHRQKNQDIIMIYHSFRDIQNDIVPHIKHITSFKTTDAMLKKSKFNNEEEINKIILQSNKLNNNEYITLKV